MAKKEHIIPKLEPQDINYGIYQEYTPEKIELYDGRLCCDDFEGTKKLLLALMYNIGIKETVKLLPLELWQEALNSIEEGD